MIVTDGVLFQTGQGSREPVRTGHICLMREEGGGALTHEPRRRGYTVLGPQSLDPRCSPHACLPRTLLLQALLGLEEEKGKDLGVLSCMQGSKNPWGGANFPSRGGGGD